MDRVEDQALAAVEWALRYRLTPLAGRDAAGAVQQVLGGTTLEVCRGTGQIVPVYA